MLKKEEEEEEEEGARKSPVDAQIDFRPSSAMGDTFSNCR